MKIAFLSASDLRSIHDLKTGFEETADFVKAVSATFRKNEGKKNMQGAWDVSTKDKVESLALHYDPDEFAPLRQQIQKARQTHDLALVTMHFQPNIAGHQATEPHKAFARHVIDAGADVFTGQHPQSLNSTKDGP